MHEETVKPPKLKPGDVDWETKATVKRRGGNSTGRPGSGLRTKCSFGLKRFILLILAVVIVALLAFVADWVYRYEFPLSNPTYGFQFLRPSKLPPGFRITASRIGVDAEGGKIFGMSAEMNLRTVDWVYEISETKYTGQDFHTTLRNFNPTSVKPTCEQVTTPVGKSYRLCHWIDYGRISVYEVKFAQVGIFIDATFPAGLHQTVTTSSLSNFVDSFAPAAPPHSIVSGI